MVSRFSTWRCTRCSQEIQKHEFEVALVSSSPCAVLERLPTELFEIISCNLRFQPALGNLDSIPTTSSYDMGSEGVMGTFRRFKNKQNEKNEM